MTTAPIPFDARRRAKHLFWAGYTIDQVAEVTDLNVNTIKSWRQREKWDEASPLERMEGVTEAQYCHLVMKPDKTGRDFKEIDLLGRRAEGFARIRRYQAPGGHEGDLNDKVANRNAGPRKKARKNHLTREQWRAVLDTFDAEMFDYQRGWGGARIDLLSTTANITRFILKSRQIGATFYFAREAIARLIETGNNQIFISASRAQANVFRQYIVDFVFNVTGVKLEGDPITLDLDDVAGPGGEAPKLYFLGTNYKTAQSYHGDVYIDECFWIHGFEQINDVASAMATHARYRITYFSTPSTRAHQAHRLWSGESYNQDRPKADRGNFKFTDDQLRAGVIGTDDIWRQRVTLLDAKAGGCELIDVDRQRKRYSVQAFDNLYMCEFIDDSDSMFPFTLLQRAMVESWDEWTDFEPYALRPFGDRPVWIGYDPAESAAGDDAAMVIVAPPETPTGKFRVLEKHRLQGKDFQAQAAFIIAQLDRYNVEYIGIDSTGAGSSVYKLVADRFINTRRIDYNVQVKTEMVHKAKNVFSNGRIEFDRGAADIAQSFMAIRAQLTNSQRQITYVASRAGDTGHADLAWAIMHALYNEPLDPSGAGTRKSRLRIFAHGNDNGIGGGGAGELAWHRAGRGYGWRRARQGDRVPLRRSGAGARSARVPLAPRGHAKRALLLSADPDVRPGARL